LKPADPTADLHAAENARRERCWNPVQRWQALQATITWAENQATVRRNTPARCLEQQRQQQSGKA
jgi:hypothetical protein